MGRPSVAPPESTIQALLSERVRPRALTHATLQAKKSLVIGQLTMINGQLEEVYDH
jgi:hypothetical protein